MTHHSYFTGFAGLDFAAQLCGISTTQQCEKNKFCIKFCNYFFPGVPMYRDIYKIDKNLIEYADIASAGFPCQNISHCGDGSGIYGEKSKTLFQFLDIAFHVRYRYLLFENSAIFPIRGMEQLLCKLAQNGYDAQWVCLQASDFGYTHERKRIFIVAYPSQDRPPRNLFRPVETIQLHSKPTTSDETYLRITDKSIHTEGNYYDLCGVDGFSRNYRQIIAGLGNAVNITMAEYVYRCILDFNNEYFW